MLEHFFPGTSEMSRRLRVFAWSTHSMQTPESWPETLRASVRSLLMSGVPTQIWWGPAETVFYNDACIPFLPPHTDGTALGRVASDVWSTRYDGLSASAAVVRRTIEAQRMFVSGVAADAGALCAVTLSPLLDSRPDAVAAVVLTFAAVDASPTTGLPLGSPGDILTPDMIASKFLDSIPDAFFSIGSDWRFTFANQRAADLLGIERDSLIGRNFWETLPSVVGTDFETVHRRAMAARVSGMTTAYYPNHERWYEVRSQPAENGIAVYFRDVTGQRRASEFLAAAQQTKDRDRLVYEAVLSNTPDLAYVFDLDHRFIYANERLLNLWGKTRHEAVGKTCLELGYEPWHAEMHDREIEQVKQTKLPIRGEVPFAGVLEARVYEYIFVPVLDTQGEVIAVAGTTRDVSERKEKEEELRVLAAELSDSDRRKNEFLAMLAHELRNPLAPILTGLEIIRQGESDPDSRYLAAGMMRRQVAHMVRLVDDLLDVSRISRGNIEMQMGVVDLATVVHQAIETCQPALQAGGQKMRVQMPSRPIYIEADAFRMAQVLSNLIGNAIKYSPTAATIGVTSAIEGKSAVITVRDQGVGIPPEMLQRIFDIFTQVDVSLHRAQGGLGIGLTLVRTIVELHGGAVEARSDGIGRGSTFIVRLPVPAEHAAIPSSVNGAEHSPAVSRRILIVDDNRDAAISLSLLLSLMGNATLTAFDGFEAVEVAATNDLDVILLDIGLPKMNGYECCRAIRAQQRTRPVLIIALTGWGQEEDRRKSREAGFDAHLVKPVAPDVLMKLFDELSTV